MSWSSRTLWLGRGSSLTGHFPWECSYSNRLKEPHWPRTQPRCGSPAVPVVLGSLRRAGLLVAAVVRCLDREGLEGTADGFTVSAAHRLVTRTMMILAHTGHSLTCLRS